MVLTGIIVLFLSFIGPTKLKYYKKVLPPKKNLNECFGFVNKIENGNWDGWKRQPDHRADNSRRLPMGLQCSEKLPHPERIPQLAPKQICILVQWYDGRHTKLCHTKLRIIHKKLKLKKHVYYLVSFFSLSCLEDYNLYELHSINKPLELCFFCLNI